MTFLGSVVGRHQNGVSIFCWEEGYRQRGLAGCEVQLNNAPAGELRSKT